VDTVLTLIGSLRKREFSFDELTKAAESA